MPSNAKASVVKLEAAKIHGLCGEDVELVFDGHTVTEDTMAIELSQALVKLIVLSSGSIAFANRFRVSGITASTMKKCFELDYSQSKRRSPYVVAWNPVNIAQLAVKAKNMAWIYDVSKGEETWSRDLRSVPVQGGEEVPEDLHWTSDGKKLIFIDARAVVICDVENGTENLLTQESDVTAVAPQSDGKFLAIGRVNGISLFDMERGCEWESWNIVHPVTRLLFDPSSNWLATAAKSGSLIIFSLEGEMKFHLHQTHAAQDMGMLDALAGMAWSPIGSLIAFSSMKGSTFQVFDAQKGFLSWKSPKLGPFSDFSWNYNGLKLSAASRNGQIYLFTSAGALLNTLDLSKSCLDVSGAVNSLSWSTS
eukprot:symbB.v1.2.016734.t1/scaffold1281.1/size129568/2